MVCVNRPVVSGSCDTMDCSLPGSSVHGILQARILEWGAQMPGFKSWVASGKMLKLSRPQLPYL